MLPPRISALEHVLPRKVLPRLGAFCLIGVALLQGVAPVYRFPDPKPFAGSHFYNPYAGADGRWLTANFHAHSRAWAGLTTGKWSATAVRNRYRQMGYSVAAVSDYQYLVPAPVGDPSFIPVYEHGYNVPKTHQLVIGARHVVWGDFVFWQTRNHKQLVINELKSSAELVAIAHPELRGGYSAEDLKYLTNYDLMEIASHYGIAVPDWDVALSNGHPVWAIGDDDSHDVSDSSQTGATWTMVGSDVCDSGAVIRALRAGRAYVVKGHDGRSGVTLQSVAMHGDTMVVRTSRPVESIDFIGAGGRRLATSREAAGAAYVFTADDPYVRAVLRTSDNTLYLNPVVRYDGEHLAQPVTTLDASRTRFVRLSMLCTLVMATMFVTIGGPTTRDNESPTTRESETPRA